MALKVLSANQVAQAFGTPVSTHLWPESEALNTALKAAILAREAAEAGVQRSNIGGWHSTVDLLNWEGACFANLKERVTAMTMDLVQLHRHQDAPNPASLSIDAWANVSRDGNYANMHDHPNSVWSGVYYVSSGTPTRDTPTNGKLELIDPRVGVSMVNTDYGPRSGLFLVDPLPGLMIMFPSWLKHMVHPFFGEGERISVAFNTRVLAAG